MKHVHEVRSKSGQRGFASVLGAVLLLALAGWLVTAAWESAHLQQRMARAAAVRQRLVEDVENALVVQEAVLIREAGRTGQCRGTVVLEEAASESAGVTVRVRVTLGLREVVAATAASAPAPGRCLGRRLAWTRLE